MIKINLHEFTVTVIYIIIDYLVNPTVHNNGYFFQQHFWPIIVLQFVLWLKTYMHCNITTSHLYSSAKGDIYIMP